MNRLVHVVAAALWLASHADGQELRTSALSVSVRNGSVVGLTNALTNETVVTSVPSDDGGAVLHRIGRAAEERRPAATERPAPGVLLQRMQSDDGRWTTRIATRRDGSMEVRQYASSPSKGLQGVSWTMGIIPDRFEVLVPGNSGQRFGKDAPREKRTFEYPIGWEAGFALIQGPKGGVLIQAEDAALRPKVLTVEPVTGGFRLRFETRREAPFESQGAVNGFPWVIRPYRGPWQVGAAMYRTWAEKRLGLKPLSPLDGQAAAQRAPRWAADIRLVAIVGMDIETIRLLARRVVPRQTLLYIPGWRRDGYDRNYPDYTPLPEFGPFVAAAKQLGFRVMPHVNYFGCDPKNPEYERFRQYHMRDPFTKDYLWWDWKMADPPIKFAYINPASRAWRKLFIERMTALCRQYDIDALHLDQTLCIFNDANGRIDGMSCAEGNLALHRELKQALPNVALSGEGLNEVTCRFEEFAQRHVWGLDHVEGSWDDRLLEMAHPIASSVLAPFTTIYGYLGLPNPERAPELADAWQRAYERFGVIPTYAWPEARQLAGDRLPHIERLLRRAGLFFRYGLVPDFRPNWSPDDLFVWRTPEGGRARYVRSSGTALEVRVPGQPPLVIERRLAGAERYRGEGSISGWLAYNRQEIIGLHTRERYMWMPDPRDMKKPHLEALPTGWHITRSGLHPDLMRIGIRAHGGNAAYEVRLWDDAAVGSTGAGGVESVRSGIIVPYDRSPSTPGLSYFDEASGGLVRPDGEGLFFHPPYKGLPADPAERRGVLTYTEYRIHLPDAAGLQFRAGAHLRAGATESDGVRFRVTAWREDQPSEKCAAEALATGVQPEPLVLDLHAFRGRPIILRIEADAGPAGDPSFDWGRLAAPKISADPDQVEPVAASLTFAGAPTARCVLAAVGDARIDIRSDGTTHVETTLPNILTIPFGEPVCVPADGLDLMTQPLNARTLSALGIEGPPALYGPDKGMAACSGIERPAISLHPPNQGCSLLDYHLQLPDVPLRLVTAIGIRDGSKSNGVGFRVEVNGKVMAAVDLLPGKGWIPMAVDLSGYRGREIVLTLVTDALRDFNFDWAVWAEPGLVPAP
ncbi:MAG: hypothetical protein GX446_00210 [Chthonomonadales bacterium]|nr:hypothetical protein [Chthonomonadales bacterium]